MNEIEWIFQVEYQPDASTSGGRVPIPPVVENFATIEAVFRINGQWSARIQPNKSYRAGVGYSENDDRLKDILYLLRRNGWKPVFSILRANENHPGEFLVTRRYPEPDLKELQKAPFLCGWPEIYGGWAFRMDGETIVARGEEDEARKRTEVIYLPGDMREFGGAWSEKAAEELEAAGMKGATFKALVWETKWNRAISQPHYLVSESSFPRCRTLRGQGAQIVDEAWIRSNGEPDAYFWDDEGRFLPRMKYSRSDLEQMEGIDVARTLEHHQDGGEWARRLPSRMIFSQRFRRWAIRQGYKFRWQPIELIEEGTIGSFDFDR